MSAACLILSSRRAMRSSSEFIVLSFLPLLPFLLKWLSLHPRFCCLRDTISHDYCPCSPVFVISGTLFLPVTVPAPPVFTISRTVTDSVTVFGTDSSNVSPLAADTPIPCTPHTPPSPDRSDRLFRIRISRSDYPSSFLIQPLSGTISSQYPSGSFYKSLYLYQFLDPLILLESGQHETIPDHERTLHQHPICRQQRELLILTHLRQFLR